jgi:hypothetical protein
MRLRVEVERILGQARQGPGAEIMEESLRPLPEPVARYLRAAGVVGRPAIRNVHLTQRGLFLPYSTDVRFR